MSDPAPIGDPTLTEPSDPAAARAPLRHRADHRREPRRYPAGPRVDGVQSAAPPVS